MNHPEYSETQVVQPVYPPYPQQPPPSGMNPNVGQAYIVNQPAQVGYANGCGPIIYTCSPAPVVYTNYKAGQSKFLGIAQIIIGILCIAFNAASIGIMNNPYKGGVTNVAYGIWGGVFFIITGSFGVAAAEKKSRCFVITFMVFCIISAVSAAVILGLSAVSVATDGYLFYSYYGIPYVNLHDAHIAMCALLLILSVCEGIFSIWGSVICCKVACCGAGTQQPDMIPPDYSETQVVQPAVAYPPYPQQPPPPGVNPNVGQAYIVNQPAQIGYANGCGPIIYTCSPAPVVYTNYKAGQSKFLGIAQIIIGILCIAFNAASIGIMSNSFHGGFSFVGHGIWCGVIFIVTGPFGIAAAAKKSRCFIITFMVFCIISSAFAAVVFSLSIVSLATDDYHYYGYYGRGLDTNSRNANIAMCALLLIMSVCEGVFSIWGSVICCKVACCGAGTQQPAYITFGHMNGNQQVIMLTAATLPSQPVPNTVYSMAAAPMPFVAPDSQYQPLSQPDNLLAGDMNRSTDEKRVLIPE